MQHDLNNALEALNAALNAAEDFPNVYSENTWTRILDLCSDIKEIGEQVQREENSGVDAPTVYHV